LALGPGPDRLRVGLRFWLWSSRFTDAAVRRRDRHHGDLPGVGQLHARGLRGPARRDAQSGQARREQHDAEARLQVTQSAAGVGPWDWDIASNTLYLSPGARKNLGLPAEGPVNLETLDQVHPDDRAYVSESLRAAVREGAIYEVEYRLADTSQGERWVHGRGEVERDETGRAVRILGLNFDVTNRRRAEQQVRESEARFRSLADSAPALMWVSRPAAARVRQPGLCRVRRRRL
jgi:PAS domain S-box-containing protein